MLMVNNYRTNSGFGKVLGIRKEVDTMRELGH
jgi:hypothetical protein